MIRPCRVSEKATSFKVGDMVTIRHDFAEIDPFQDQEESLCCWGIGDTMPDFAGERAVITKILDMGDVRYGYYIDIDGGGFVWCECSFQETKAVAKINFDVFEL